VGGSTIISNLQLILINHTFPECNIPLHLASRVPWYPIGVGVSSKDSATPQNYSLPDELLIQSPSRWHGSLMITVDDPRYHHPSPPVHISNDIIIITSASISPQITHQAVVSLYRDANSLLFSYIVCQMPGPNSFFICQCLLLSDDIVPALDFRLQQHNSPL
jgi:hypothetical protein